MDLKRPSCLRAATMDSMALPPTFFTAARPKRMVLHAGEVCVRYVDVRGFDGNAISRHSLMYFTTSSVLPVTEVSSAAMNSTG